MSKERVNHALIQMEQNLSHPSLGIVLHFLDQRCNSNVEYHVKTKAARD